MPRKKPQNIAEDGELVYLGPQLPNCQIVFKPTDSQIEIGTLRHIEPGKDITGYDVVSLEPCKNAPGYRMKYLVKAPKGPAKVSTDSYRAGWDRTFGSN